MSQFNGLNWDLKPFSIPDYCVGVITTGKKVNRGATFGLVVIWRLYVLWR